MSVPRRKDKDGNVAVLVSINLGMGWSTTSNIWDDNDVEMKEWALFDPDVVDLLLADRRGFVQQHIEDHPERYAHSFYCGGLSDLTIVWLPEGTAFYVEEYDGAETLITEESLNWRA